MITKEQILHLAELARLKLTDDEIEKLTEDLNKILSYVEKIQELNLKDIEPLTNILERLPLREDEILGEEERKIIEEIREKIIKNFPQKEGSYLKVPKILEK
jgi:aspartyl-tRNA(Asn)/glutamyl-tRNA(Gln) amidotransferase subunit C